MTDDPDLDRVLHVWLEDGPTSMPDRVALVVAERTAHQSQRPSWHAAWRQITMNVYAKFIVGAAAVLIVVAVGFVAYTAGSNPATVGGTMPSTTVAPTEAPTAAPTPTASPAPSATPTPLPDPPPVEFVGSLPEGWTIGGGANYAGTAMNQLKFGTGTDDGGMQIELQPNRAVMAADCTFAPGPGIETSAAAIVEALASRPGLVAGPVSPAAIGGLAGQQVDLRIDPAVGPTCTDEPPGYTPLTGYFAGGEWLFNGVVPDEPLRLIVVDTPDGGNVTILVTAPNETSFDRYIDDATAILDGIEYIVE